MRTRIYTTILCTLIAMVIIISISACTPEKTAAGSVFKDKYTNLVNGKEISLKDMKDHVLIVNYWATWCPACRDEVPGLIELYSEYKDKKFAVIGISVDKGGESVVKEFIEEFGINYPVIMNTKQLQSYFEKAAGRPIRGIPMSAIIDRKGEVVSVHVGFRSKDIFEQEIQKLL
jgi:thiol-disulfide isomerase/thioredoxin